MDNTAFIAMIWFIFSTSFTPGPGNILSAAHSIQHGFDRTIKLLIGLISGWAALGLVIGFFTTFIQQQQFMVEILTWVCVGLIIWFGWKIGSAKPISESLEKTEELGFKTGFVFSLVNGKAWAFHLTLMGVFGMSVGSGYLVIIGLVVFVSIIGFAAISSWALMGVFLKKVFSSPRQSRMLNILFGASLVLVAVDIALRSNLLF